MNTYCQIIYNISNKSKYTNLYITIIENLLIKNISRKSTKEMYGAAEAHHILPKSFNLGGKKDKQNIVFCSPREHFILHLILIKMFNEEKQYKMKKAISCFIQNGNCQQRKFNSWEYTKIRLIASEASTGKNNPRFGKPGTVLNKKCYTNGIVDIFLSEFAEIPIGFAKGSKRKNEISITNGIENKRIFKEEKIPIGWEIGSCTKGNPSKLKNRVLGKYDEKRINAAKEALQNKMFITNGIIDKKINIFEKIPFGWYRGRTNGIFSKEKIKCKFCDRYFNIGNLTKHIKNLH